jgi:xylulokinase
VAGDLYIGIDLGTTGIKVGLFAGDGSPVAEAAREMHLKTPRPGFAEFDGKAYADLCFEAIREVLAAEAADAAGVKVIGFSSQAETFVLLGEDDLPVRPAISWLDVRAPEEAEELSKISGRAINAMTSCPKVLWLKRNEPASITRARRLLVVNDYLIYLLTGRAATDPVTARSTGGYDDTRDGWDASVIAACGLSRDAVPEVLLPGEVAGQLTAAAAEALGLATDVLVAVGTNDQTVGAIGAGNVRSGCASVSMGTALAVMVSCDTCAGLPAGLVASPHPAAGGDGDGADYIILAFAKTSGVVLKWFRETFAAELDYEAIFAEIAAVPPGSEGLICLPHFSGTGTPDFNAAARGAFSGFSLAHTRAHMARAIIESLSFTVRENLEFIAPAAKADALRAIGGGARSDVWCQMIADVTGLAVERPRVREAACLGAAELAMVAGGRYESLPACSDAIYTVEKRFEPSHAGREAYDQAYARYRELRALLYGKD